MVTERAEGIAWDFLAGLRQRFDAYLDVIKENGGGATEDWLLSFLKDVNDILVVLGQLENRIARLERRSKA